MQTSGAAAKAEQLMKSVLAPERLELKIGAEVMFVANNFQSGFVNGSRGQVVDFDNDEPIVVLQSGREVRVQPHSWALEEDGHKRAEVTQLPLRLAWAITIHKSQGMSMDAAEIDLSRSFTPGMGYVALSRVRSLDGVYLKGINRMALAMHPQIFEFDAELREQSEALANITPDYEEKPIEKPAGDVQVVYDKALFEKLKSWRLKRAEADHVPAYIIAHNTVLEALSARPPESLQALRGIKGMGPAKIEKYGEDILSVVSTHKSAGTKARK
jgi:hypothetical protein